MTIELQTLKNLIGAYARDRVLVEEYEDATKKEKRIALNYFGDEMEKQEYHETVGMILGYEDWFRVLGVYKDCMQVLKAMEEFKREYDHEVFY